MRYNSWSKFVNTRKPHVCFGCSDTIPQKSRTVVTTTKITYPKNKRFLNVYWCDVCLKMMFDYYKPNDCVAEYVIGKSNVFKTYRERIEGAANV